MRRTIHFFILLAPSCLILLRGSSSEHIFCSSAQTIPKITQKEATKLAYSKHNNSESQTWGICKLYDKIEFADDKRNPFNVVKRDQLSAKFFTTAIIRIKRQGKSWRTARTNRHNNVRIYRDTQRKSHIVIRDNNACTGSGMNRVKNSQAILSRTMQNKKERHKLSNRGRRHHEYRKLIRDRINRGAQGRLFVNRCARFYQRNTDQLFKRYTFLNDNSSRDRRRYNVKQERTRRLERQRTKTNHQAKSRSRESLVRTDISPVYQDRKQKRWTKIIWDSKNLSDQNRYSRSIRKQDNRRRSGINTQSRMTQRIRQNRQNYNNIHLDRTIKKHIARMSSTDTQAERKKRKNGDMLNTAKGLYLDQDIGRTFVTANERIAGHVTLKPERGSNRNQYERKLTRKMSREERFIKHKGKGTRQILTSTPNNSMLEQQYDNKIVNKNSIRHRIRRQGKVVPSRKRLDTRRRQVVPSRKRLDTRRRQVVPSRKRLDTRRRQRVQSRKRLDTRRRQRVRHSTADCSWYKRISRHPTDLSTYERVYRHVRTHRDIESRRRIGIRHANERLRHGQVREHYVKAEKRDSSNSHIVKKANDRRCVRRYNNNGEQPICVHRDRDRSTGKQCLRQTRAQNYVVHDRRKNIKLRDNEKILRSRVKNLNKLETALTGERRQDATHHNNNYQKSLKADLHRDRQIPTTFIFSYNDTTSSGDDGGRKAKWKWFDDDAFTAQHLLSNFSRPALIQREKTNDINSSDISHIILTGCIGLLTTGVVLKQ